MQHSCPGVVLCPSYSRNQCSAAVLVLSIASFLFEEPVQHDCPSVVCCVLLIRGISVAQLS